MTLTTQDLIRFAESEARISRIDYFDPRYPRQDEIRAWRQDCARRSHQRSRLYAKYPARAKGAAPLIPGRYYGTRLIITDDSIDYIPGQYAAVEIWQAVTDYFCQTNTIA